MNGGHPVGDPVWSWIFLACLVAAFVLYLVGLVLLRQGGRVGLVLALAAAIQLAPVGAPLLLSTDAWTFWSYARLDDPYRDTPSEDPVSAPHVGTAWLHETSVYGPAFSLASEPVGITESSDVAAWTFKTLAALAMVAATLLAARLCAPAGLRRCVRRLEPAPRDPLRRRRAQRRVDGCARARRARGGRGSAHAIGRRVLGGRGARRVGSAFLFLPLRALEARAMGRRTAHLGFALTAAAVAALATIAYGLDWLRFVSARSPGTRT